MPMPATPAPRSRFDGVTIDYGLDEKRLKSQIGRVWDAMLKTPRVVWDAPIAEDSYPRVRGFWYTLAELEEACDFSCSQASISARMRDFRKPRFGGHTVERRRAHPGEAGTWEYRLTTNGPLLDGKDRTLDPAPSVPCPRCGGSGRVSETSTKESN